MWRNKYRIFFFYLSPAIIFIFLFIYYPVFINFYYSLFSWSSFSPSMKFIGFTNYIRMFQDQVIAISVKNNFIFAVISVIFQVGLSMVLASVLEERFLRKFSSFFRTVYFLPSLISITVCGIMFQLLFNPNMGIINAALTALGFNVSHLDLLGNAGTAIYTIVGVSQWQYIGYNTLLFIVAIQKIPAELYEASVIDGAGIIKKFRFITVPQIKEMTLVTMVVTMIGAFKVFDEVYIMTGGGPGNSTQVLATYLQKSGFNNDEMGYASTIAVLVFVITFALSIIQMKISKVGTEQ